MTTTICVLCGCTYVCILPPLTLALRPTGGAKCWRSFLSDCLSTLRASSSLPPTPTMERKRTNKRSAHHDSALILHRQKVSGAWRRANGSGHSEHAKADSILPIQRRTEQKVKKMAPTTKETTEWQEEDQYRQRAHHTSSSSRRETDAPRSNILDRTEMILDHQTTVNSHQDLLHLRAAAMGLVHIVQHTQVETLHCRQVANLLHQRFI